MAYEDKYIKFYHSKAWKLARKQALTRDHYLCQECLRQGIVRTANTVHHIVPIKDDFNKRLKLDNLETICLEHHNQEHREKPSGDKEKYKKLKEKKREVFVFKANPDFKL